MVRAGDRPIGRVIVVASVNVDLIMRLPRLPAAGQTVLGGVLSRQHGGKGANQAVAAARAGAAVHVVGAVGEHDGDDPVAALAAESIDVTAVARVGAPTGHAFVLVEEGSGENQIAVASGANALLSAAHVTRSLAALRLAPADVVVLSFEVPEPAVRAAARAAATAGARLVINPAPARAEHASLLTGAISTPNAGEVGILVGGAAADISVAAATLAQRTSAPVLATRGADGAVLAPADGTGTEHFPSYRVDVRDTTGAGDTLTGVLAASLAAGGDLRASVRRAMAAAALAVTRDGARSAMPTAAEIEAFLR